MTVVMSDGHRVTTDVRPSSRLSERAAILEKFDRCAVPVVGRTAAEILKEQIATLDQQPDLGRLMAAASRAPSMRQLRHDPE